MLRMFKVTSPMSVGSWVLAVSGAATGAAAAHELTGRFGALAGRPSRVRSREPACRSRRTPAR